MVGGQGQAKSDLHPSISGTWEGVGAGAAIGSGRSGLECGRPWGRHHPSVTAELGWLWEWRLGPHGRICLQAQLEVLWVLAP